MNAVEIRAAVDSGKTVHWSNKGYVVVKDKLGEYYIKFTPNNHCIGLTHQDGVTLNGKPEEFYIAEPAKQWMYRAVIASDKGLKPELVSALDHMDATVKLIGRGYMQTQITELKLMLDDKEKYTLSQVSSGRFYHPIDGHSDAVYDLTAQQKQLFKYLIGGHGNTQRAAARMIERDTPAHFGNFWAWDRIVWEPKHTTWMYIAGQDYTHEMNQIRAVIRQRF